MSEPPRDALRANATPYSVAESREHCSEFSIESIAVSEVLESQDLDLRDELQTHARGPEGALPHDAGDAADSAFGQFVWAEQDAGMGWDPARMLDPEFLILSTHGGMRAQDGTPIALGFHSGHWEVGLLVAEAARELKAIGRDSVCRRVSPIHAMGGRRARRGCSIRSPTEMMRRSCCGG